MSKLDLIDKQILNLLLKDAEQSYAEIAKQIHTSVGTVHVRLKRLRELGMVQGRQLRVSQRALGYDVCAFLGIFLERSSDYVEVLAQLREIPEVLDAHYVTGAYNIFAKLVCKDTNHLREVLYDRIQNMKGVQRTESFISLEQPLQRPLQLPINWLEDEDED